MAGQREVSLLFSGGVDSTTAALLLAERYDRVHLLTWGNGYGHYRIGRTRRRVEELRRHCGDRFVHVVGSVRSLFERMLPDPLAEYRRYGSAFIWCLGCKMAMHMRAILYDLEHGITEAADGSSQSTGEMVEQMLLSVCLIREMYEEYGIAYRTPVYTFPREREVEELRRRGFRMGLRIGSRFLGIQPKCKPGELYYIAVFTAESAARPRRGPCGRISAREAGGGARRDRGVASGAEGDRAGWAAVTSEWKRFPSRECGTGSGCS